MSYQEERLQEIADAIRSKSGKAGAIPATSFASEIRLLPDSSASSKPEIGLVVTPTKEQQVFTPSGNTVYNEVTVEKIPDEYIIPTGTLEVTENGTKDVTNYASIEVNVAGSGGGDDSQLIGLIEGTATELNIPSGTTKIKQNAFYQDTVIAETNIPESVTSIGKRSFYYCSGLTSITIPKSITNLGDEAFYYCSNIAEINFNAVNCADKGEYGNVFINVKSGCVINIGEDVLHIPQYLFYNNTTVNTVNFIGNSKCTSIGSNAFSKSGITSLIIPDSVTSIGLLSYWNSLQSVVFGSGLINLEPTYMFSQCKNLTSVLFHDNLQTISSYAFYMCSKLTELLMPSSLKSIGDGAFVNCSKLVKVDFSKCTSIPTLDGTLVFANANANLKIYVPDALYDEWIVATNWSNLASKISKASEMPTT